jgi:hypothetical protein
VPIGPEPQKRSRRAEERTAKLVGGRRQPGSGNGRHAKGDVRSRELLIERKDTSAQSYVLRVADLQKISTQATLANRDPVFVVGFEGRGDYAVVSLEEYLQLKGVA